MRWHSKLGASMLTLGLGLGVAAPAAGQGDTTVTVVAGPEYAAGDLHGRLFGVTYRDLWTEPVRVPVLDLATHGGGLIPQRRGGGQQTKVLHLQNPEGREFVFRSVNKDQVRLEEPMFRGTIVARLIRDQISSLNPAAAAMLPPILSSVDLLHPEPTLVVMPDDPGLGEFREDFAGVLGWIEERPDEIETEEGDRPGFAGYERIVATDRLLELLEESPRNRPDTRKYLTARMIDFIVGDWDRHHDQWRWAAEEEGDRTRWIPVPRDRDYATVDYDGAVLGLARQAIPNVLRFRPQITDLSGLLLNAEHLDRHLLADLELPVWDSVVTFVQTSVTDSVIDAAVLAMPAEYVPLRGAELARVLRARRDDLPNAAREFYRRLAGSVDVRGTDEADLAVVERLGEGAVEVRLHARGDEDAEPAGAPYFRRRFYAPETGDVRIYLHGGDDRAVVRGDVGRSVMVRVVGGGGDDVLADSSRVREQPHSTTFYDDRGENRIVRARGTAVNTRGFEPPDTGWTVTGTRYQDWGSSSSISPVLDYRGTEGVIVGAGPVFTRQGFRKVPYAYRVGAVAKLGLASWHPGVEVFGDFRRTSSRWGTSFEVEATRLESFRFFGFGNDTEIEGDRSLYTVLQDRVSARVSVNYWEPGRARFDVGPVFMYTNPDVDEAGPIRELPRYGDGGFAQAGGWAAGRLDLRDHPVFPREGLIVDAEAQMYPGILSADGPFGSAGGQIRGYLTPLRELPVTLALRTGAERAWGDFPVHEAATLGGSRTVRGYAYQRFAGDAMIFGGAELRAPITEVVLLVRGTLGVLALADAGRVYFEGESEGGWHTATGGGLSFTFRYRDARFGASAVYATSRESGRLYLALGSPF